MCWVVEHYSTENAFNVLTREEEIILQSSA